MQTPHEAAAGFLTPLGVTIKELLEFAPAVADGECLALTGSIIEGVANPQSDIDLLYLGDGPLRDKFVMAVDTTFRLGVSHDAMGREINVEQLTHAQLGEMCRRVDACMDGLRRPTATMHVIERNPQVLKMIHRVKTCIPLVNSHVLTEWQEKMKVRDWHEYVCGLFTQDLLNRREDIIGEVEAGELESAVWMTQTILAPEMLAAMLAAVGETNAKLKWHHKLVRQHREQIGGELVDAVLGLASAPADELRAELLPRVAEVSAKVIDFIYRRQRLVRRALIGLSHKVRFSDPSSPLRWAPVGAR